MTTFTTEDREVSDRLYHFMDAEIKRLNDKVHFLQEKNHWLMRQIEELEIKLYGSR
mgnify:CR=1 FL=1